MRVSATWFAYLRQSLEIPLVVPIYHAVVENCGDGAAPLPELVAHVRQGEDDVEVGSNAIGEESPDLRRRRLLRVALPLFLHLITIV